MDQKRLLTNDEINSILQDLIPDELQFVKQYKNYEQQVLQEQMNPQQAKFWKSKNIEIFR